jgi:hypothetical protein
MAPGNAAVRKSVIKTQMFKVQCLLVVNGNFTLATGTGGAYAIAEKVKPSTCIANVFI